MGTALPASAVLGRSRLVKIAGRYSLTAAGPIAVSGAHFAASLIFLHKLTAAAMYFGNAGLTCALLLGAYGAAMAFRWFSRFSAYNADHPMRAAASDLV